MKTCDNLVVGGCLSGLPRALRTASAGPRAVIERELLRGTWVHPTLTEGLNSAAGGVRRASSE